MHQRRFVLLALTVCLAAASTARAEDEAPAKPAHHLPVFRSVLDGNARMITIPLHQDMWLAYDAETCALVKVWGGSVKLDGAVYTTVHGPQPTSRGPVYFHTKNGWLSGVGTGGKDAAPRFLGYRVSKGRVTLRYGFKSAKGATRIVEETPTFEGVDDRVVVLKRHFRCTPATDPSDLIALASSHGTLATVKVDGAVLETEGVSNLVLGAEKEASITATFDRSKAHRQWTIEKALAKLAKEEEAKKAAQDDPKNQVEAHPTDTPVGHGVSVRIYYIGEGISRLPKLVKGQTPNVSHVLPVLDLRTERGDFGTAEDEFLTHVDGWIEIEQPGIYGFRLVSDDGSRLFLDDKLVVDHDGLHGSTEMDAQVTLTKGRHKLFVEHFENGGGEQLTLSWRPPGSTAWSVVPNSALRAPTGEVRVTSPGKKQIQAIAEMGVPGDGQPLTGVHPAFDLAQARTVDFKPRVGGMNFLPDGRMVVCCWEPDGGVYVLDGVAGDDPKKITVKRIAAGLAEPLGLEVVDGRIFVLQKQELTELIDRDKDGIIDEYRCVAAGWGVTPNFHEFAFGLVHKDGHFYATLATAINPGGASTQPQEPDRGKVVKIAMDGTYKLIAQGLRTPNGVGLGVDGEVFVTDNQGDWLPVSKMVHVKEGAFYGGRSVDFEGTEGLEVTPPVVWLPQGEIGNSPGEPGLLTKGPYAGQMAHADVTHGGLKRVFVEKIGGLYQGCVFRFTQGLEAGINRWTRGPDDAIYLGGIGSAGNWGQEGKLTYGLQRLRFNGKSVFEMLAVRVRPGGLTIEFTEPLARASGNDVGDYLVQSWWYEPTEAYGGPKKDVTTLEVRGVVVAKDRRSAWLEVEGLTAGHVIYVRLARTVRNAKGKRPWSSEAWYTLNKLPHDNGDAPMALPPLRPNRLSRAERKAGFELLFDGTSTDAWRGFKKERVPPAWKAEGGALSFTKEGAGGDLITKRTFEDFELRLDWMVATGGNSGICYRLTEAGGAMWITGAEMQILDNDRHGDGVSKLTTAGSNYALYAPAMDVTRPAGRWNQARLIVRGTHVEHWLNGWKIVEFEIGSEDWKARLAKSKFKDTDGYGVQPKGHIGLQDHGDRVWFRNIKIRDLSASKDAPKKAK